ncbi:hypothetical protein Tsubulata_000356 [Turnera subulata]|uniref:Phospholipase-like protein n=1 Tax=Turnera subulata TaxID=218843 RepID=A0A9Q0F0P6_9ROSI|nr:hypothetical protein Tsubulata_000356 [Turnera subulata]
MKRKHTTTALERRTSPRLQNRRAPPPPQPSPLATPKPSPVPNTINYCLYFEDPKQGNSTTESQDLSFTPSDYDAVINSITKKVKQTATGNCCATLSEYATQTPSPRLTIRAHGNEEYWDALIHGKANLTNDDDDGVAMGGNFHETPTSEAAGTKETPASSDYFTASNASSTDSIAPEQAPGMQIFKESIIATEMLQGQAREQHTGELSRLGATPEIQTASNSPEHLFDPLAKESQVFHGGHCLQISTSPVPEIRGIGISDCHGNMLAGMDGQAINGTDVSRDFENSPSEHISHDRPSQEVNKETVNCSLRRIGSQNSFHSFGLTDMLDAGASDDDDSEEVEFPAMPVVYGYRVNTEYAQTLEKIIEKYGDIAERCIMVTPKHRSLMLEELCKIIRTFGEKSFSGLAEDDIQQALYTVQDIGSVGVNVSWLQNELENMLEARQLTKKSSVQKLKEIRNESNRFINEATEELKVCEAEMSALTEKMSALTEKKTLAEKKLSAAQDEARKVKEAVSKVKYYAENPPLRGIF